jgi:cytosine/uracil/thiamine/allantoin permease
MDAIMITGFGEATIFANRLTIFDITVLHVAIFRILAKQFICFFLFYTVRYICIFLILKLVNFLIGPCVGTIRRKMAIFVFSLARKKTLPRQPICAYG